MQLVVNKEKWHQLQPTNYSFYLELNGFFISGSDYSIYRSEYVDLILDMQSQQFADYVYASENYSLHPNALYNLIEDSIWDAGLLEVSYDKFTGLPVNIKIDKSSLSSDDDVGIKITNILTLPGTNCTDEQIAGLQMTVLDSATDTNISLQATALVHNADHSEYLFYDASYAQGQLTGLHQRAGRFEATITSLGFVDKHLV